MSEPFLRLPHGSAMALVSLERSHPGIAARFIERWLMCVISRPPVSLEAALNPDDMRALEAVGLAQNNTIQLISVAVANISSHRANGKLGGAKSAQTRTKLQPNPNQTSTKPEPNLNKKGERRKEKGERRSEKGGFSSVGSFGADAPTEPPSLTLAPEPNKFPSWPQAIEALCEAFRAERGAKFVPDGKAMKDLKKLEALAKGDADEVLRRWRIALRSTHPTVGEWGQLLTRWNLFASEGPGARKAPSGVNLFTGDDPNAERDFFGGGR